jgi:hypothetical protein
LWIVLRTWLAVGKVQLGNDQGASPERQGGQASRSSGLSRFVPIMPWST